MKTANHSEAMKTANHSKAMKTADHSEAMKTANHSEAMKTANHSEAMKTANHSEAMKTADHSEAMKTANHSEAMKTADHSEGKSGGARRKCSQTDTKREVFIKLSGAQVSQVFREAIGDSGMGGFLFARISDGEARKYLASVLDDPLINNPGISRSMVIGFVILCALTPPGRESGVNEIAKELGTASSTTHRYIRTLVALGLVEQVPDKRTYRLALNAQSADVA